MPDAAFTDVVVGRVFIILGVKNSEMEESEWRIRARAVFQGSDTWARTGRSPEAPPIRAKPAKAA